MGAEGELRQEFERWFTVATAKTTTAVEAAPPMRWSKTSSGGTRESMQPIGALALYVLAEKLAPRGRLLSRASGLLLAGAGVAMLAGTV
jgi:hypothetical protein